MFNPDEIRDEHGKWTHGAAIKALASHLQTLKVGQQTSLSNGTTIHAARGLRSKREFKVTHGGEKATPQDTRRAMDNLGLQHSHLVDGQMAGQHRMVLDHVDQNGQNPARHGGDVHERLGTFSNGRGSNSFGPNSPIGWRGSNGAERLDNTVKEMRQKSAGLTRTHKLATQAAKDAIHGAYGPPPAKTKAKLSSEKKRREADRQAWWNS